MGRSQDGFDWQEAGRSPKGVAWNRRGGAKLRERRDGAGLLGVV